jgi:hypothetical protein
VRKAALIPLLLIALVLAACGGGGSSSSGSTSSSNADSAEAAWAKEVRSVMSEFENDVSAAMVESLSTSSSQPLLEPLYRAYGIDLARLAAKLEATQAPQACVAARQKIAAGAHRVAQLNKELGEQKNLSQEKFSFLVEEQGVKIHAAGRAFTSLIAKPSC